MSKNQKKPKLLPILSCIAGKDLVLNKGAAAFLMNNKINSNQIIVEVKRLKQDGSEEPEIINSNITAFTISAKVLKDG